MKVLEYNALWIYYIVQYYSNTPCTHLLTCYDTVMMIIIMLIYIHRNCFGQHGNMETRSTSRRDLSLPVYGSRDPVTVDPSCTGILFGLSYLLIYCILVSRYYLVIIFGFYPVPLMETLNVSVDNLINN